MHQTTQDGRKSNKKPLRFMGGFLHIVEFDPQWMKKERKWQQWGVCDFVGFLRYKWVPGAFPFVFGLFGPFITYLKPPILSLVSNFKALLRLKNLKVGN